MGALIVFGIPLLAPRILYLPRRISNALIGMSFGGIPTIIMRPLTLEDNVSHLSSYILNDVTSS